MTAQALLQIIAFTPKWVFALLAGLIALGFMQARRRKATLGRLMIAPVALSMLSLQGVIAGFGSNPMALALWPLAASAVTWLLLQRPAPAGTSYDPATRTFDIAGSWAPMALFLSIFIVKYAVGVSLAMNPALAQQMAFAMPVCLLNGAFSGLFIARGLRWFGMTRPDVMHGIARASSAGA